MQGRTVFVFPDLSENGKTFAEWQEKAKEYEQRLKGTRFECSKLLEQLAPESDKGKGNDIADYLIKLDWRNFRKQPIQEKPNLIKPEVCEKSEAQKKQLPIEPPQPEITTLFELQRQWYCSMLEAQFKGEPTPEKNLKLGRCKTLNDAKELFTIHYQAISSKPTSGINSYLERLQTIKQVLTNNMN